ncbi:MAG: outer membrane lipid asymmetry maintenance protein MlaD [Deltaproteobacteria bacterium]|nr:outer membrane lipid asymmetry maintenance protein MlaD [Deltaproteobacteria bacterium]
MRTLGLGMSVGGFLLVGALSLVYLFTSLGEVDLQHGRGYTVYADFTNASGLAPGSAVEVAGVRVGQVTAIDLNGTRARVRIKLSDEVRLQDDVIASIQTKGLLGERYLLLTPGGSDEIIPPGGKIRETESPLDLPGLMAAYVASRKKSASTSGSATTP